MLFSRWHYQEFLSSFSCCVKRKISGIKHWGKILHQIQHGRLITSCPFQPDPAQIMFDTCSVSCSPVYLSISSGTLATYTKPAKWHCFEARIPKRASADTSDPWQVFRFTQSQILSWCLLCLPLLSLYSIYLTPWLPPTSGFMYHKPHCTWTHLLSLGRLRHGRFKLHVSIVVGNSMPTELLFSSPLHPGEF